MEEVVYRIAKLTSQSLAADVWPVKPQVHRGVFRLQFTKGKGDEVLKEEPERAAHHPSERPLLWKLCMLHLSTGVVVVRGFNSLVMQDCLNATGPKSPDTRSLKVCEDIKDFDLAVLALRACAKT